MIIFFSFAFKRKTKSFAMKLKVESQKFNRKSTFCELQSTQHLHGSTYWRLGTWPALGTHPNAMSSFMHCLFFVVVSSSFSPARTRCLGASSLGQAAVVYLRRRDYYVYLKRV